MFSWRCDIASKVEWLTCHLKIYSNNRGNWMKLLCFRLEQLTLCKNMRTIEESPLVWFLFNVLPNVHSARKRSMLVTVEIAVNATKGPQCRWTLLWFDQWLDWMLWVRCVCQGLHCHERKERYHLKDPESIKQQYNLCEDMVPLNRFRIQYIQWSIVGFRGYRVLAAVAALKQAILYCFVFLLRTSSTLCSYHIQFPNFPCVYPYFWNVMACHGILA